MNQRTDVIVVGGGVAGIAANTHLRRSGLRVTLVEQRQLLGGRAGSFPSKFSSGEILDNCQHVLLGCCTELQELYRLLGVSSHIRFDDVLHFMDSSGRYGSLRSSGLPAPLHLAPSFVTFGLLPLREKLEIARAMAAMLVARREEVENETFAHWLTTRGQSPDAIAHFWDVICISALNEPCATASAKYGLQVFQEAFLKNRHGFQLGYAKIPLSHLYSAAANLDLMAGCTVKRLLQVSGRVTGVELTDGRQILASHVVLATSAPAAWKLLEPLLPENSPLANIKNLTYQPIIGVHLRYDRPIVIPSPVALLGVNLHWAFADQADTRLVHGVTSAAETLCNQSQAQLLALFDKELRDIFQPRDKLTLLEGLVIKEVRATFRPIPGADALRPMQKTTIPGLTLAGDYTRTEWPATM